MSSRLLLCLIVSLLLATDAFAQISRRTVDRAPLSPTPSETSEPQAITGFERGQVRTLPVSGETGVYMETIMASGNGWIYGLEAGEKRDQPCYLGMWAVEGATPGPGQASGFERCANTANQHSVNSLGFAYAQSQEAWNTVRQAGAGIAVPIPIYAEIQVLRSLFTHGNARPPMPFLDGEPVALDGVGICRKNSNDEMKGMRIHGSTLDLTRRYIRTTPIATTKSSTMSVNGVTVQVPAGSRLNEEFDRPNCTSNGSTWEPVQTCPNNQVLVGLDVHYKFPGFGGNQSRARITGLAPKCARIRILRG